MNGKKNRHTVMQGIQTEKLMLHGIGFVSGDPTIKLEYPYVQHTGMRVSVTEPGKVKWLYMMLPLSKGSLIKEVNISCHCTNTLSRITHLRLVEQGEPTTATLLHDSVLGEEIFHTNYVTIRTNCDVTVKNSILLKLCLNFLDTDDLIEIGSVAIKYVPAYDQIDETEKMEEQFRDANLYERLQRNTIKRDKTKANYFSGFLQMFFSKKIKERHI